MSDRDAINGVRLASLIGAIAGTIFILVNAGGTGDAAAPIRIAGVALFVAAVWWGVVRAPSGPLPPAPTPQSWRVYRISVLAELIAIPVGANIINRMFDRSELTVLWVVAVVGFHFLPFAKAFGAPVYRWLGVAMILLAAVGTLITLAFDMSAAPAWFAVGAGVALLSFSIAGPRKSALTVTSARP